VADRFDRIFIQMKALAEDTNRQYKNQANRSKTDASRYKIGDQVWISTKYIKTNKPIKKGDNKWTGPYAVTAVYPKACAVKFPDSMRIFPVFHNSLLRFAEFQLVLPGQDLINNAKLRYIKGKIFIRKDKEEKIVEKWEFDSILNTHNENEHHYLIQ
jgi:hypothetical protein